MFMQEALSHAKGVSDGVKQILVPKRLGEKINSTGFHCVSADRYVTVASDEDE